MNIYIEYKHETGFDGFFHRIAGKKLSVLYDVHTKPYAEALLTSMTAYTDHIVRVEYPDEELLPTEEKCEQAYVLSAGCDYVLAVGSGTLNDMAKYVSTRLNVPCGVLATAASMDGYCSKGAALMRNGYKVTDTVHAPQDILIDLEIIRNAPKIMTAAGFGDILGKYTCLTDWQLSNILNGEEIHEKAYTMMKDAVAACVDAYDGLTRYEDEAVGKLMNALIMAGLSMAECGNSRPASGSEHHQSHFLEMDFARRGEKIPMHGIKVGIGTLVAIELYNYVKESRISFDGAEKVYKLVENLPSVEEVKAMLEGMGCPTRFSEIGVRRETMEEMLEKAYTVRDRYTILTFIHDFGLTENVKSRITDKYY